MAATLTPSVFALPHTPHPTNSHPTATLTEQAETEELILDLLELTASPNEKASLSNPGSNLQLRKGEHVTYVCSTVNHLPAPYVSLDASRPWLLFWTMHSLDLLGCALDDETKKRYVPSNVAQALILLTF
jgi:protein farnesyltransferase subunit beta